MCKFFVKPELEKKLSKVFKKDKVTYERVMKKIEEIACSDSLEHYKHLRQDMKRFRRAHIGPFVLVFSYKDKKLSFEDFDHHDNIYRNQP